ncbi:MAG TPA: hypothetical protein VGD46_13630, partial [Rhizobacter sp.]
GGMKTSDVRRDLRLAGGGEWAGIGWTDSSWELAHGLEVVEDLPPDAWPVEFSLGLPAKVTVPQKN